MTDESGYRDIHVLPLVAKQQSIEERAHGLASEYRRVYNAFRDVGFTDEQAMQLMFDVVERA